MPEGSIIDMEIPGLDPGSYELFADIIDPMSTKHRTSSAMFTVQ